MAALPVDRFGQMGLHDVHHADLPVLVLEHAQGDAIEAPRSRPGRSSAPRTRTAPGGRDEERGRSRGGGRAGGRPSLARRTHRRALRRTGAERRCELSARSTRLRRCRARYAARAGGPEPRPWSSRACGRPGRARADEADAPRRSLVGGESIDGDMEHVAVMGGNLNAVERPTASNITDHHGTPTPPSSSAPLSLGVSCQRASRIWYCTSASASRRAQASSAHPRQRKSRRVPSRKITPCPASPPEQVSHVSPRRRMRWRRMRARYRGGANSLGEDPPFRGNCVSRAELSA